jgi:teichoic acid transport system permease protein
MSAPVAVYEPFRAGLPPLGAYRRALWARRSFIAEFSRSELREQNYGSVFGQLWLVLNPLLLSGVYFLLIYIIGGQSDSTRYGHLTASLFLFYLVSNSLTGGVKSITAGQRLILNTAFPRIMLPISAMVIALFKFIPTLAVFFVMRTVLGLDYSWQMFWAIPVVLIALLMGLGMAILISCINVYFRDIASFLPYMTRSLLYLSPILYQASDLSDKLRSFEIANPIFYLLDAWSQVMVYAQAPDLFSLLHSLVWALAVFIIGTYFFLSRERDFAVRL